MIEKGYAALTKANGHVTPQHLSTASAKGLATAKRAVGAPEGNASSKALASQKSSSEPEGTSMKGFLKRAEKPPKEAKIHVPSEVLYYCQLCASLSVLACCA